MKELKVDDLVIVDFVNRLIGFILGREVEGILGGFGRDRLGIRGCG